MRTVLVCAVLFIGAGCDLNFGSSSRYSPSPPQPSPYDPPSRIARLSYLDGSVSLRAAGSGVWTPAVLNRPVTTGDELWTGTGARAELHLGFAVIRLDEETHLGVLELGDDAFQAKLTQGVVRFTMRRLEHGDAFEIDTPNASFTPSSPGEYRIEVSSKTKTTGVVVSAGEAEVTNAKLAVQILAGQRARINGASRLRRNVSRAPQPDRFDQFCQARDRAEERAESRKYVPYGVLGAYDLDDRGIWLENSELSAYWTPRSVPRGWAPYRFGRWNWIEPWGWTWIDDSAWGFAPFHYGRWAWQDGLWSWFPPPARGEPVYAPALVAFGELTRSGKPTLAWFPLAPKEIYVPAYRASLRHLIDLNPMTGEPFAIDPATFPRQAYANRLATDAITAVARTVFLSGLPVQDAIMEVRPPDAATLKVTASFPQIAPEAQSLAGRGRSETLGPSQDTSQREVILRRSPARQPVAFEQRLPLLKAHPGRPPDPEALQQLRNLLETEK